MSGEEFGGVDKGPLLTYNGIVKTCNKQEYQVGTAPTVAQRWREVLTDGC